MRTIETDVFTYSELSEQAQAKARDWYRDGMEFDASAIDDAKAIGDLFGLDVDRVFYSGFCSQGDGACFEGAYRYEKRSLTKVKEYAPQDSELHSIVERLADLQKRNFYALRATTKQRGHYQHSGCMAVEVEDTRHRLGIVAEGAESDLADLLLEFADWIYKRLECDYEYQTSDETVSETIEVNGYEYTAEGVLVC